MKIVIGEGCTGGGLNVDGVENTDEKFDQGKILEYLIIKLREKIVTGEVQLESIIRLFPYDDYYQQDEPCEQCGDTYSSTTWNLWRR